MTAVTFQHVGLGIPRCWCCKERETRSTVNAWVTPCKLLKAWMSVEVKLSLPLDTCPVCSIPLDFLWVFKPARDVQMHAFTDGITDACCKNSKVETEVICSRCLPPSLPRPTWVNSSHCEQIKKTGWDEMPVSFLTCLFWSVSLFCCFFHQTFEHSFALTSLAWPCSCHLGVPCHHREAISNVAARRVC